jgi:hypothetical protein
MHAPKLKVLLLSSKRSMPGAGGLGIRPSSPGNVDQRRHLVETFDPAKAISSSFSMWHFALILAAE